MVIAEIHKFNVDLPQQLNRIGALNRTMMKVSLIPAFLLLAVQASCQVKVAVFPSKAHYIEGEPISVIVRVTNVGSDPLGHDYCDGHVNRSSTDVVARKRHGLHISSTRLPTQVGRLSSPGVGQGGSALEVRG